MNIKQLHEDVGVNVMIVSYRGYGESEGEPSEDGMITDAETAYATLRKREDIDATKIIIFGRSLGGAVAIALTAR